MLNVGFHATNGKDLKLVTGHREIVSSIFDGGNYTVVEVTLNEDLTLFLSPENATQLAKALLSQVQQIEEKEIQDLLSGSNLEEGLKNYNKLVKELKEKEIQENA